MTLPQGGSATKPLSLGGSPFTKGFFPEDFPVALVVKKKKKKSLTSIEGFKRNENLLL